jgi:(1->4)-alpha-D-glucan 1-alpha-D-glucosylmutase
VLTEMPGRFGSAVHRWSRMNSELRTLKADGSSMPDRNTEYFYYQSLIGAWPVSLERIQEYMLKAVREGKQQTSWVANNVEFEEALSRFIEATFQHAPFVEELEQFVESVKETGWINSLAQTLMKHTSPGVPDLYQGTELWDLSLVDPDNRRPVDYKLRCNAGDGADGGGTAQDVDDPPCAALAPGASGVVWRRGPLSTSEGYRYEEGACDCISARG